MKKHLHQILYASNLIGQGSSELSRMLLEYAAREKDNKIHKTLLKELVLKVSEQSRKLEEQLKEIEEKNKKLEELSKLKNQFLGMAAHDLRNPIAGIKMGSSLLLEINENLTEEEIDILKEINNSSNYMSNLLNDLLDVSAIESGNLNLNKKKENYIDFIKYCVKFNKGFAEKKNIFLEIKSHEVMAEVNFDRNKITQVINNLIGNAIKYSFPDTKIIVEIIKENDYIITSIIDQGQGIPSRELPDVFKEFHRTSVQTTAGETSTGLGLAIVKRIIEGHKGKLGVESEVGVGSRFYFSLPIDI